MTREEAIKVLEKIFDTYDEIHECSDGEDGYKEMTALEMAITALETQKLYNKALERRIEFYKAFERVLDGANGERREP